ncbi:hypothetical protein DAI22_04g089100 [Oryza sativa Japonica Group]|nr:hypothetical protein DAI22_04g089100 [Oryza sativa Japonica Group]KAF2933518.1 hypothetical protein DAI22_04g089100 [Oryza sativa Japonica Group]
MSYPPSVAIKCNPSSPPSIRRSTPSRRRLHSVSLPSSTPSARSVAASPRQAQCSIAQSEVECMPGEITTAYVAISRFDLCL